VFTYICTATFLLQVRLRKQALTAMLAFAAKPPGRSSLLPQPSSALSPYQSMSGNNATATAAAAAAATDQQPPPAAGAVSAVAPGSVRTDSAPDVGSVPGLRRDSIPEAESVSLPAPQAAAAAAAAAAAVAPAPAGGDGGSFTVTDSDSSMPDGDRTQHMSFQVRAQLGLLVAVFWGCFVCVFGGGGALGVYFVEASSYVRSPKHQLINQSS
jgi:hypothetical protein